jgi:hypothetical protein
MGRDRTLRADHVAAVVIACLGSAVAVTFHLLGPLPRNLAIAALLSMGILGAVAMGRPSPQLAPALFLLAYTLPFTSLAGHLFSEHYFWWWTPQAVAMISQPKVVAGIATVGFVGLAGLLSGILATRPWNHGAPGYRHPGIAPTLGLPSFTIWLLASLVLSAMSARTGTILQSPPELTAGFSWASRIHFPGAFLLSYIGIFALFLDVEREQVERRRRSKFALLFAVVAYIVVFLQLLRGDRESVGLIVGLSALFVTRPVWRTGGKPALVVKQRLRRALPLFLTLIVVLIALGYARYVFYDASSRLHWTTLLRLGLANATWTAVLLTNLQTAWDYATGALAFEWGRTYVDYLLSLPPGIVSSALGFERPFEPWRGSAWDVAGEVGAGGIHVVLVPFRNFGAPGAFLVLFGIGAVIGYLERGATEDSAFRRLLWASIVGAGLYWFWYGDMHALRAVMGAVVAYLLYCLTLGVSVGIRRPRTLQLE